MSYVADLAWSQAFLPEYLIQSIKIPVVIEYSLVLFHTYYIHDSSILKLSFIMSISLGEGRAIREENWASLVTASTSIRINARVD